MQLGLTIINPAEIPFNYVLFLRLPQARHCASVVWMTGEAPPKASLPLTWSDAPAVVLGSREDDALIQDKTWPVALHTRWRLEYSSETDPDPFRLVPVPDVGTVIKDDVIVENRSGIEVNVGMGVNMVGALYMENILSNENVIFKMAPVYHLGLLAPGTPARVGQVVDNGDEAGTGGLPVEAMLAQCTIELSGTRPLALVKIVVDEAGSPSLSVSYVG
ncbi:hypothetical protein GKC30_08495 [Pseudodesulfovibrio sp. F-1]|uniref:Uncharacterized protein n=1 Tax=Pseudodesulfovibrio alkaliphilus TaxID=2661613 RepID=A0A7K1KNT7_9BACT|nr:hypothetical protein [Pseudodesulfovibrio alkaliphilus]MUM77670.1 hypothetical protein [Pseudodesulfovibrio alkaliphilus]